MCIAVWFALVSGLIEGVGLLVAQHFGWLEWYTSLMGVWLEIIWISPLFDLVLFGGVSLVLVLVMRVFPRMPVIRLSVFLFAFMAFVDGLALTGRIRLYAVVILAAGLATVVMRRFRSHEASMLRFWRRSVPWVVAVAALVLLGVQGGLWARERIAIATLPQASSGSPNILVIVVDTLRADHLSSYGYERNTSPNIDGIARRGVVFENAFATSSWTAPSHASLLTGRYPYEHGVKWNKKLDGRYPTLGEVLQSRGYRTGAFSGNTVWFSRRWGYGRGFIYFDDYFYSVTSMILRTVYGYRLSEYGIFRWLGIDPEVEEEQRKKAYVINRSVLSWIKRDREHPFLAVLNYMDPHEPYSPPEPYRSRYSKLNHPRDEEKEAITPARVKNQIDGYDGEIAYVDDHVGQLVAELEILGLAENTLIVITSDHGESFGERALFGHGQALYRWLIQVPLIFSWPGHVPSGARVKRPVTNAAISATVMDLIGKGEPTLFPDPSLRKLWENSKADLDWPFPLAELEPKPFEGLRKFAVYYGRIRSLVSPRWHYIVHEKLGTELYDWRNDPQEAHNLAQTPEMQGIVQRFRLDFSRVLGNAPTESLEK